MRWAGCRGVPGAGRRRPRGRGRGDRTRRVPPRARGGTERHRVSHTHRRRRIRASASPQHQPRAHACWRSPSPPRALPLDTMEQVLLAAEQTESAATRHVNESWFENLCAYAHTTRPKAACLGGILVLVVILSAYLVHLQHTNTNGRK